MVAVYLNYPNPKISAHRGHCSSELQRHDKSDRRVIQINTQTLSGELMKFEAKEHRFAANPAGNDMWLDTNSTTGTSNTRSSSTYTACLPATTSPSPASRFKCMTTTDSQVHLTTVVDRTQTYFVRTHIEIELPIGLIKCGTMSRREAVLT